jgi:predicted metal-dependent phosphoesterase TrpH
MSERFDLHIHSTASDGTLTPTEIVQEAEARGIAGLALTDHDTVAGLPEAVDAGRARGVVVVPGTEISVSEAGGARQMHMLGFGIDPGCKRLAANLEQLRRDRLERGLRILERLRKLGIQIPDQFIRDLGARGAVGRPHIAEALVRMAVCRTVQEAFDRFIGRRAPAFVPRRGVTAVEAIHLIHEAGGIAVLAHPPLSVGVDGPGGLERFVAQVARLGIDGIEVQHPSLSRKQRKRVSRLARLHGLVQTGGTDFHGASKPDVVLGRGRGDIRFGPEAFRAVLERLRERGSSGTLSERR